MNQPPSSAGVPVVNVTRRHLQVGSIAATKQLAAHCRTFGLGMNLHSGGELGISTAAHLAVVASTPELDRAIDSMYYLHADDIVEPLQLKGAAFSVCPPAQGLAS